jgi:hypothetical protein
MLSNSTSRVKKEQGIGDATGQRDLSELPSRQKVAPECQGSHWIDVVLSSLGTGVMNILWGKDDTFVENAQ